MSSNALPEQAWFEKADQDIEQVVAFIVRSQP